MRPINERQHFHVLDALRGVAAIAVVTRHLPDQTLARLLPSSYLAVDLFFALSGFVLAHAYLGHLKAGMTFGQFAVRRIIRLYPLYLLGWLIGAAVALYYVLQGEQSAWKWMASVATAAVLLPTPPGMGVNAAPFPSTAPRGRCSSRCSSTHSSR